VRAPATVKQATPSLATPTTEAGFWLRTATLPNEASESRWIIVDAEAVPTAAIELSPALRILKLRGPHLLGLWTGSVGVQTVRSYDLNRGEGLGT